MKIFLIFLLIACVEMSYQYDVWNCMSCQQSISSNIQTECKTQYPQNYTAQRACEDTFQQGIGTLTSCLQTHGCYAPSNGYRSNCICTNCSLTEYTKNDPYNKFLKCLLNNNCGGDNRGQCSGQILRSLMILTILLLSFIFL